MIYTLRHRTAYAYETYVAFARCVLRLTPANSARQGLHSCTISVTPTPAHTAVRGGAFGEQVTTVLIDTPHKALVIEARAVVEVFAERPLLPFDSPGWEAVRAAAILDRDLGPAGPASFVYPSERSPDIAEITDYARASFARGRPVVDALTDLTKRLHRDFRYDSEATDVTTPVVDSFRARHGVCQDFAHIMIAGLRGLGLPAAYVSGYLRTVPPPGKPRLAGADATHAWVSVWCGQDYGWIGFDPTNALVTGGDHIVLASGRDYADVTPIEGIILGPGRQTLKVEVDVIPQV
ncbi:MAG: transglutaminase family protein [Polymorphobacter sp.]